MTYYISDLHLDDKRVFDLCCRPFSSLEEMRKAMIKKWNSKVNDTDDVYILGDLSMNSVAVINDFFSQTKGHKHLIVGNHDENLLSEIIELNLFDSIDKIRFILDNNKKVCLCHYPIMDWQSGNKPIYHIYGHIHNKNGIDSGYMYEEIRNYYRNKLAFNASVDVTNFEPVTLDELIRLKEEQ